MVPDRALSYLRERQTSGKQLQHEWNTLLGEYAQAFPRKADEFAKRRRGELGDECLAILDSIETAQFHGKATRETNGALMERLWPACEAMCGGGADLINSNKFYYSEEDVFQPHTNYTGR